MIEPGQLVVARRQIAFDSIVLSSSPRGVLDGERVLETRHPGPRLRQVQVVTPERNGFAHSEAVPVHHHYEEVVADAVPASLGRIKELFHLGHRQEVLAPLMANRWLE
jgi:hypothetical protein